jgi:hypothetical protein
LSFSGDGRGVGKKLEVPQIVDIHLKEMRGYQYFLWK